MVKILMHVLFKPQTNRRLKQNAASRMPLSSSSLTVDTATLICVEGGQQDT